MYTPLSDLSLNLLHSLPKKVMMWLQGLGVTSKSGKVGRVTYYFPADTVDSHLIIDTTEGPIRIDWSMDIHSAAGTTGSHIYFLDLENHLDWFIELEQLVYNDFEIAAQQLASLTATDSSLTAEISEPEENL